MGETQDKAILARIKENYKKTGTVEYQSDISWLIEKLEQELDINVSRPIDSTTH